MPQKTYYSKVIDKPGTVYQRARNIRKREPLPPPSSSPVLIIRQPIKINVPDLLDPSKPLPPYGTQRAITFEPIDIAGSSPELAPFLKKFDIVNLTGITGPSHKSVPFHESQQPTETEKAPDEEVLPQANQTKDSSDKCASSRKHKDNKYSKSSPTENSETSSESASSKKSRKHDSTESLKREKHVSNKSQEELDKKKSKKEKKTSSTQTSCHKEKKHSKIKSTENKKSAKISTEEGQQKPSNKDAVEPSTSAKPPPKPPRRPKRLVWPKLIPAIAQAAATALKSEVGIPEETISETNSPSKPKADPIPPGLPQPAPTAPLVPDEAHKRLIELCNKRGLRCSVCTTQDVPREVSLLRYPSLILGPLEIFETEGRHFDDVPTIITILVAMLQLSLVQQYNRYTQSIDVNEAWIQLLDLDSGVFDSPVQSQKPEIITTFTRAGMLDQYLEKVGSEHIAELEARIHQEPFDVSSDSYFETLTEEEPEPVPAEQIVLKDVSPLQADSKFESGCKDNNIETETPDQGITETRSHDLNTMKLYPNNQVQKNPKRLFNIPFVTEQIYDDFKMETKTCKDSQIGLSPTESDDLNMETDDEIQQELSDLDMKRYRRVPGPVLRVALNKAKEESDDSNIDTDDEVQREFSDSDTEIERKFHIPVLQVALNKEQEEHQTLLTESDDSNMETDDEIQREFSDSDIEIERRFQIPVPQVALNKEQEKRQTSLTESDDLHMETKIQREFSDSDMEIETFEIPQQANIQSATFQTAYSDIELETFGISQPDAGMDTFQLSNNEPQPLTMNAGLNSIFQLSENDQMILNTLAEVIQQELNKPDKETEVVESYLNEVIDNDNYLMDLDETEFTDLLNIDIPLDSD